MMSSAPFQIQKIKQLSIPVHELDAAVAFYQENLGLPLLFRVPNMAFLDCDGIRILLSVPETEKLDHPSSIVYFQVEDIDASYQALLARDVHFIGKPHKIAEMNQIETWMVFFKDPDENVHALTAEKPVSAKA
ncbi:VOC family protein [Paenibacillus sp. GP183]|jgi:methylmalonyl-CoA/ethylmalonyl-CoA epimerase|uniref:VOC family protein n=1 Tax=Paenibacillus sp. GP183 TaxID=1882751 RepID=UPI000894FB74|nr:VOC family protein [Paenibacillus sp. GP183]SEC26711.1 Glyoxalase/Bleomycin resistance protein/Dioxygenase superfamily protein [Paenibacillus sp. GP183]